MEEDIGFTKIRIVALEMVILRKKVGSKERKKEGKKWNDTWWAWLDPCIIKKDPMNRPTPNLSVVIGRNSKYSKLDFLIPWPTVVPYLEITRYKICANYGPWAQDTLKVKPGF